MTPPTDPPQLEDPAAASTPTSLETHVLVVEDDPPVLAMACHLLQAAGYEVSCAGSAEEALVLAAERPPDVLFCDVMLPGATGIELARDLTERDPRLAVLLTSGQRSADVRAEIDRAGHPFLPKPYTAAGLHGALHAIVSSQAARE